MINVIATVTVFVGIVVFFLFSVPMIVARLTVSYRMIPIETCAFGREADTESRPVLRFFLSFIFDSFAILKEDSYVYVAARFIQGVQRAASLRNLKPTLLSQTIDTGCMG